MSRSTAQASWFQEHYEKLAVVIVLVALLGSALFLWWQIGEASRALNEASLDRATIGLPPYTPVDPDQFKPFADKLESPPQIAPREHTLLVSELRVVSVNPEVPTPIPYAAMVCPWTQYPQPEIGQRDTTGDGIPDEWYVSFGLDPFAPTIASRDMDGDGFTVREEFEAGTSPVDPEDHPPYATRLRLRRVARRPFALRFEGIQQLGPDDIRFHLNDLRENRSYFVREGEAIQGYRVAEFEARRVEEPDGRRPDASVLTLVGPDERRIELVINVDFSVEDRVAEMIFLIDGSIHRKTQGDTLILMGTEYIVVDIGRNRVLVKDARTEETIRVEEKTEEELLPRDADMFDDDFDDYDEFMGEPTRPVRRGVGALR